MNLMTLLRLSSVLVFGWVAIALGAGVLGVGALEEASKTTFFLPVPALHDAMPSGRPDGPDKMVYQLLDRTTGTLEALALPDDPAWSLLSVSPWRDREGNLQAVGRWVRRGAGRDEFCGLGLVRLPDMTVRHQITLDVLPTGKPCWVPGRPGEILFPAGDGQLYRCNVGDRDREPARGESALSTAAGDASTVSASAVTWDAESPGSGFVYLDDPAWSAEPSVRHLVFVAIRLREHRENRPSILPSQLWWLVMNEAGDAIVDAGRLTEPELDANSKRPMFERMPTVVVGAGGKLGMVYLTRSTGENTWRMRSAKLVVDVVTGRPRLENGGGRALLIAKGLAPASMVVSANGDKVFAIDAAGRTVRHSLPD